MSDGTVTNQRSWFRLLSIFTDIVSAIGLFFTTLLPFNSTVPVMRTSENNHRRTTRNPSAEISRSNGGTSVAQSRNVSSSSTSTSTSHVFVNHAWLKNNGFPDDQAVRSLLIKYVTLHLTLKNKFPGELIYKIFTFTDGYVVTGEERTDRQGGMNNMNYRYLMMPLFNTPVFHPVSVEFTVVSNDQGWTSEPGPTGQHDSFTWGEAAIATFSSPPSSTTTTSTTSLSVAAAVAALPPSSTTSSQRYHIYTNRRAERRPERQVIKKDHTDELLQDILESLAAARDDQRTVALELWLRSQYPGWTNTVHEANIQITWEMTDAILLLDSLDNFVTFK